MFRIIRESLKFNKLPSKRISALFAGLVFCALFLFKQFPLGDPHIKAFDKLLDLEWSQLVSVLQKLYASNQLSKLISTANITYYISDFVFKLVMLLLFILFFSLQIAVYRKNNLATILKRFVIKQPVIWLFLIMLMLAVIAFGSMFSPLPIVAIALCLFLITQALFVPTLILDYNYKLMQAFVISRQIMQGFKLNFLVNFMLCHFMFSFIPQFVLTFFISTGPILNLALALSTSVYTLICLRCLFIYYFYLSEYYYPQIRDIDMLDISTFFEKLNTCVYPMYTEEEKSSLLSRLQAEYSFEHHIEKMLLKKDISDFKHEVLETELPLKRPLNKLLQEETSKTAAEPELTPEREVKPEVESKQSIEEKQALLSKNIEIIQAKLEKSLSEAGYKISKKIYLEQAASSIASDFYRSSRQTKDLERLINKMLDYLKRTGRVLPLYKDREGLN